MCRKKTVSKKSHGKRKKKYVFTAKRKKALAHARNVHKKKSKK